MTDKSTFSWTEDFTDRVVNLTLTGHKMLVRKCIKDQREFLVGDINNAVEANMPAHLRVDMEAYLKKFSHECDMNWCRVLAVGPKCNTRRSKQDMKFFTLPPKLRREYHHKYSIPWTVCNPAERGDYVVLPEVSQHARMWRGATGKDEDVIIDECEIILLYKEPEEDVRVA